MTCIAAKYYFYALCNYDDCILIVNVFGFIGGSDLEIMLALSARSLRSQTRVGAINMQFKVLRIEIVSRFDILDILVQCVSITQFAISPLKYSLFGSQYIHRVH